MKKNILIALFIGVTFCVLSFSVVKVDLSFNDVERDIVYNLEDEYYFFSSKTRKWGTCDVICWVYRWYPFSMRRDSPVLHEDMRWKVSNILYNILFYFSISLIVLLTNDLYWTFNNKKA